MALIHNVDFGFLPDLNPECQHRIRGKQCQEYAAFWCWENAHFIRALLVCPNCLLHKRMELEKTPLSVRQACNQATQWR